MIILARLLHIVFGVLWVGFMVFMTFFLGPALGDTGPDGAKVMGALQKRGLLTAVPIFAITAMLSGLWLIWKMSGGFEHTWFASRMGMSLSTGALLAIIAFIVGMTVTRPAMMKAMALGQQAASATPAERESLMAEAGRMRQRGTQWGRVVAVLLLLATAAMGVARYL